MLVMKISLGMKKETLFPNLQKLLRQKSLQEAVNEETTGNVVNPTDAEKETTVVEETAEVPETKEMWKKAKSSRKRLRKKKRLRQQQKLRGDNRA